MHGIQQRQARGLRDGQQLQNLQEELRQAERRKRFDGRPDWVRLMELMVKLERCQKSETTEAAKAAKCEDEGNKVVKRAQRRRQRAAQSEQLVQPREQEVQELVVAARTGDGGAGGEAWPAGGMSPTNETAEAIVQAHHGGGQDKASACTSPRQRRGRSS